MTSDQALTKTPTSRSYTIDVKEPFGHVIACQQNLANVLAAAHRPDHTVRTSFTVGKSDIPTLHTLHWRFSAPQSVIESLW